MSLPFLFSPFSLRGLQLKNRIVMPAMGVFLVEADGSVTDRTLAYYRLRARGGGGMVMVEASAVAPEGIVSHHQMRIHEDRFVPGLARIAQVIREEGATAAIQIHHAGRQTSARVIGRLPYAPSPLPCPAIRGDVEVLGKEGIQRIVSLFGDAAARSIQAGFQLIEIHGAHGYLINQFLSGYSNIRGDEYGGDTKRRSRFAAEVVREVRRRVGPAVPISFKISAQEFVPGGLEVEESIEIVRLLQEAGIDAIQVSAGNDATPEWISQPMLMPRGCLVETAHRIKTAVSVPVICVGRINGPKLAEEILRENKADLVCMGRALLADPELPRKALEGRLDEIRRCVACNTCISSIFHNGRVECLVNPELSREQEMVIRPAPRSKRIWVVGGGPGGCEAAWVSACRGHRVDLFEAKPRLGGQIQLSSLSSHKKELLNIVRFHTRQLALHGVRCHLGRAVTAREILDERPDAVILATGGSPHRPQFLAGSAEGVFTFQDVLSGDLPLPRELVIAGGGAVGCELALHLSEKGHRVTILEMTDRLGAQYEAMTRKLVLSKIRSLGVQVMTGCRIVGYDGQRVQYVSANGGERTLRTQLLVLALGIRPQDSLSEPLRRAGVETHRIGDCQSPKSVKEAILEGARLGRSI